MNLKTYYRAAVADLRLRIADIAPALAIRGGLVHNLSADGADAVIRLGTPSRPVLGYLSGAKDDARLYPADGGEAIRLADDDAPWAVAALAARHLAAEAGGGLHAVLPDWNVKLPPPAAIFAPADAGGFIISMGDDRLESLAKVRARLARAAVDAAFAVIEAEFEAAFAKADTIVKDGAVYGDYNIPVAYVTTDYRKGLIIVSDADGSLEGFKPGRTEPVDWADMEYVVRPMIETTERWLREHDYYIGVD